MASSSATIAAAILFSAFFIVGAAAADENSMEEKCGADFQKLAVCLSYATGKAAAPTKDCCESVEGIKDKEPECLCFIIQQTNGGNDKVKSMGIQESRLLHLPSACSLKNASLSNCPKLLGLSPNSPDAAIFTSNSTATPAASTATATSATGSPQSKTTNDSNGCAGPIAGPLPVAVAVAAVIAVFVFIPPK